MIVCDIRWRRHVRWRGVYGSSGGKHCIDMQVCHVKQATIVLHSEAIIITIFRLMNARRDYLTFVWKHKQGTPPRIDCLPTIHDHNGIYI